MDEPVFDPKIQVGNLDAKIVVALERIAEVFRTSLWEVGKKHGLSPLQVQLLIFLNFHSQEKCKVSYLALEFNLSKPTISEAVRTLLKKELIRKETDPEDTRSYTIYLTPGGRQLAGETATFANGLTPAFSHWSEARKGNLYNELLQIIGKLQQLGYIQIQRSCLKCRFLKREGKSYYCNLLKAPLEQQNLRVDCPEFEAAEN